MIYRLWKKSYTVDQISVQTMIPRSTVGYYVRKFNRLAQKGKPAVLPREKESNLDSISVALFKALNLEDAIEMMRQGDAQDLYYKLASIKLLKELGFFPTPEEAKALLSSKSFQTEASRSKSLSELIKEESET